jgi:RimJ/RimL family protein N-acetyltransferase
MSKIEHRYSKLKNNLEIRIRSAETKDARNLLKLEKEIIEEHYFMITEPDEILSTIKSEKSKIREYNNSDGRVYIIAELGKQIIGTIFFRNWQTKKTKHCGLMTMYVKKEWRDCGLGSILIETLINWAKMNQTIKKITLAVFSNNLNAIALYKKFGFITEGICPKEIRFKDNSYADTILMYLFV